MLKNFSQKARKEERFQRPSSRWEENIKACVGKMGCEDVNRVRFSGVQL
jgi:hypothetical protein